MSQLSEYLKRLGLRTLILCLLMGYLGYWMSSSFHQQRLNQQEKLKVEQVETPKSSIELKSLSSILASQAGHELNRLVGLLTDLSEVHLKKIIREGNHSRSAKLEQKAKMFQKLNEAASKSGVLFQVSGNLFADEKKTPVDQSLDVEMEMEKDLLEVSLWIRLQKDSPPRRLISAVNKNYVSKAEAAIFRSHSKEIAGNEELRNAFSGKGGIRVNSSDGEKGAVWVLFSVGNPDEADEVISAHVDLNYFKKLLSWRSRVRSALVTSDGTLVASSAHSQEEPSNRGDLPGRLQDSPTTPWVWVNSVTPSLRGRLAVLTEEAIRLDPGNRVGTKSVAKNSETQLTSSAQSVDRWALWVGFGMGFSVFLGSLLPGRSFKRRRFPKHKFMTESHVGSEPLWAPPKPPHTTVQFSAPVPLAVAEPVAKPESVAEAESVAVAESVVVAESVAVVEQVEFSGESGEPSSPSQLNEGPWYVFDGARTVGPLTRIDLSQKLFIQELDFDCECWQEGSSSRQTLAGSGVFVEGFLEQPHSSAGDLWIYDGTLVHGPFSQQGLELAIRGNAIASVGLVCEKTTLLGWKPLHQWMSSNSGPEGSQDPQVEHLPHSKDAA